MRHLLALLLLFAVPSFAADCPSPSPALLQQFLDKTQIYSMELPNRVGFRWDVDAWPGQFCVMYDIGKLPLLAKFGWTSLGNFAYQQQQLALLRPADFGPLILSTADKQLCFNSMPLPNSPDGATIAAPLGQLVTKDGRWSFSSDTGPGGNAIMLNWVQASGGFATNLYVMGGKLYALSKEARWFVWTGTGWSFLSTPPQVNVFKVAPFGGSIERPLYQSAAAGPLVMIGSVKVGTQCEAPVVRTTTSFIFHNVTNLAGTRGMADCK